MNVKEKIKVLIFPAEAENAFEVFQALRYAPRLTVWGASSRSGYGNILFDNYRDDLPYINDEGFIEDFNKFIEENGIDLIFPTHDDVAVFLAGTAGILKASVVGSGLECAKICRDKKLFYTIFGGEEFCPKIYGSPEEVCEWPVFLKPSKGQGGVGSLRVDDYETLRCYWDSTVDPVICEFLPGEEYTVDCLSDRHGSLRFIGPRTRDVVRIGISFVSKVVHVDPEVMSIAEALSRRLNPRGLWFFQIKRSKSGCLKLLEASCRPAGTMSVYRQLGVNLPLLAVYDALGTDFRILKNDFQLTMRRRLHSSYEIGIEYRTVYVDYDDTLVVGGIVNATLMHYIYECINRGKRVVLISKHPGNLEQDMRRNRVFHELFDEVIHLEADAKKADYLCDADSIFIDNLFSEREQVFNRLRIPVFDVDAVEALL